MQATYIDHMGDDLSVVNAAKVSFGKRSDWVDVPCPDEGSCCGGGMCFAPDMSLSDGDKSLIQFLARGCTSSDWQGLIDEAASHGSLDYIDELEDLINHIRKMPPHWSPFAHTAISIHLKMPIFVARQIMKHTTGLVYNEVSRRYVDDEPEFYFPDTIRNQSSNVKQGSSGEHPDQLGWGTRLEDQAQDAKYWYQAMIKAGVATEQARMILPQSMYTEVIATGNLYAWANLFIQRTDSHAQKETQFLAHQVGEVIEPLFPVSWEALTK